MKALFFGSIGVFAETSELQRQAYNTALAAHGVDWHWNVATYCQNLATPGGQNRLRSLGGAARPSRRPTSKKKNSNFRKKLERGTSTLKWHLASF